MCETVRTAQDRTPVLCEMCEMPIGIALRTAFRTARHGYSVSHSGAGTLQLLQRKTVVRRCQTVNVPARREYRLTRRFPLRAQDGLSDDGHRLTDGLSDGRGLMQAARCMRAMGGAGSEVEAGPGGRLSAPMRQSCANRAPMLAGGMGESARAHLPPRGCRAIPHRLEDAGYVPVRNPDDKRDGQWRIDGKRQSVYARDTLSIHDRIAAVRAMDRR